MLKATQFIVSWEGKKVDNWYSRGMGEGLGVCSKDSGVGYSLRSWGFRWTSHLFWIGSLARSEYDHEERCWLLLVTVGCLSSVLST